MPWVVMWHTRKDCPADTWHVAPADSEASAWDRARHFQKLGFPVFAMRSDDGSTVIDREELEAKLASGTYPTNDEDPGRRPGQARNGIQQDAIRMSTATRLRSFAGRTGSSTGSSGS